MQSALALMPLHVLRGADVHAAVANVNASAIRAFRYTEPRFALEFVFHIKIFRFSNREGRLELWVNVINSRYKRY
jgi:hypothetical protein